jgi:hypothetical protein
MSADIVVKESQALLIMVLGPTGQNLVRFQTAREWTQPTDADFVRGGVGLRVDQRGSLTGRIEDL